MVIGNKDQIERLIEAVNEIANLTPTSAEAAPVELSTQPGTIGGLPLDKVVDANIGRILGATPTRDPKRIVDLLTGAFEKRERVSTTYYEWRQRGSVPIEGSLGGQIAGEQATLYQELKDREDAANRLLDAMVPIILGPDEDEINEVKDRIRTTLSSIVAESGRPGGALLDKIDVLLLTLDSDLRELKEKLGLDEGNPPNEELRKELDVATAEQIRANFDSLETTYIGSRTLGEVMNRLRAANDSSSTRLSRLLRAAEAIPNTVQQVYAVMDSVRFGEAERRVTGVESDTDATTFEQLFTWIEQTAALDWPASLIGGGAKRSEVIAVRLAAQRQNDKINKLLRDNNARLKELLRDIGVNRVSTVLAELGRELKAVKDLASEIVGLPGIQSVVLPSGEPATGAIAGGTQVLIKGFNFRGVQQVLFGAVDAGIFYINNEGTVITVNTPCAQSAGAVDVTVDSGGDVRDTLSDGFTYLQPPAPLPPAPAKDLVVKFIFPKRGPCAGRNEVFITGLNLSQVNKVTFGALDATVLEIDSDGAFLRVVTPATGQKGAVTVVVSDPNKKVTLPGAYTYK